MTVAQVTQLGTQGVVGQEPDARVTQDGVQGVISQDPAARLTQEGVQLIARGEPQARLTRMFLQSIVKAKPPRSPGRAREFQTATTSTKGIQGDPHWRSVAFLLNGEHGFRDCSRFRAVGVGDRRYGPLLSTDTPKFVRSLYCASTATYGLRYYADDPKRWYLGKKPFTIECWLRAPLSGSTRGIVGCYNTNNDRGWALLLINNAITFYGSRDNTQADLTLTGSTISPNTWTHVCVERGISGRVRMYVNGEMVSFVDFPDEIRMSNDPLAVALYNPNNIGGIGGDSGAGYSGFLDQIRITKGVARYDSNAGFEVPIAAYPFLAFDDVDPNQDEYWDLVTCLVNAEQDPPIDLKRGATITGVGRSNEWNEGTSSNWKISGTGTIAHVDGQWDLGGRTEPFTLEMDAGYNGTGNGSPVFMQVDNSWRFWVSRGSMGFQYWDGASWVSPIGSWGGWIGWWWSHNLQTICVSRDAYGTWRIWRMGQLVGKFQQPAMLAAPTTDLTVSPTGGAVLDNIRMTWGAARYTSDGWIEDYRHALPYPLSGPPYVAPPVPEPVYPLELPFPSADEPFDSNAWNYSSGAVPSRHNRYDSGVLDTGDPDDFYRWWAGNSTRVWNFVTLPIPIEYWDDVDAGKLYAETSGSGVAALTHDDYGAIVTSARTSSDEPLRYSMTNVVKEKTWTAMHGMMQLPPGTRSLRCGFLAYRSASGQEFVYRDVGVKLLKDVPEPRVYITQPSYPPVIAEWTDIEGGEVALWEVDWGLSTLAAAGKHNMDLRCTVDLPEALVDEIDAGQAAFRMEAFTPLNTADTDDLGRMYFEFLDAADAVVGRRKLSDPVPYIPAIMQKADISAPIPAGARKVVIGIFGSKSYSEADANNVNFQPSMISGYCYVPLRGNMPDPATEPPMPDADPHWKNVRLLLSSRNGVIENLKPDATRSLTVNGTVAVEEIATPFGDTSAIGCNLAAAATSADYLDVQLYGSHIGPKMTFEGWFMKTGHNRSWAGIHNQLGNGADNAGAPMRLSSYAPYAQADFQLAYDEWYHVAICRDETGRGVMFVNGKKQKMVSGAVTDMWLRDFRLGWVTSGDGSWIGYFDEIRITHGVERYTEDFTPPGNRFPTTDGSAAIAYSGDETGREQLSGDMTDGDDVLLTSGEL